jgi:hypothetical protein
MVDGLGALWQRGRVTLLRWLHLVQIARTPQPTPAPEAEEEFSTIYARIPRTLFMQLRRRAFELSYQRRLITSIISALTKRSGVDCLPA